DPEAAVRSAVDAALSGLSLEPRICIVLAEAFSTDPSEMLVSVRSALPPGVEVLGGASARSDLTVQRPTYQICDDELAEDGIAVLIRAGPGAGAVAMGTGWTPIGALGRVTAASPGSLAEVDGRPAIEFVSRYLDATGPASFGNPIAVFEDGALEPYLRVALGTDAASGAVRIGGSVPIGARVRLTT